MTGKTKHGIEACEDCRKIVLLIAQSQKIRFNALLKQCQETISKEYSAPKLSRHLKGLKSQFIKRTKISSQEVIYSLSVPLAEFELQRKNLELQTEKLKHVPLNKLIDVYLGIYGVLAFEELIIFTEKLLKKSTPQALAFRLLSARAILSQKMLECSLAMTDRKESEYIEILKSLKNERDKIVRNYTHF